MDQVKGLLLQTSHVLAPAALHLREIRPSSGLMVMPKGKRQSVPSPGRPILGGQVNVVRPARYELTLRNHVEVCPVRVSRRRGRRLAVPVIHETFRRRHTLEDRVGRSDQETTDDKRSLAAIRVG